jgi:hypothetical protein
MALITLQIAFLTIDLGKETKKHQMLVSVQWMLQAAVSHLKAQLSKDLNEALYPASISKLDTIYERRSLQLISTELDTYKHIVKIHQSAAKPIMKLTKKT